jgi:pimeloyl-ACP methyl ester carboxylesterase
VTEEVVRRRVEVDGAGGMVPGALTLPATNERPSTLLLLGHGGGGGKDERQFPAMAARLATELDCAVLAIDGPAHGERAPKGDDPAAVFRAGRRALVDPEMPARFADDWARSVEAVRADGIGTTTLLYAGFSMGTLLGVPAVAHLGAAVHGAVFGVGGVPRVGGVGDLVRAIAGDAAAAVVDEEDDAPLRGRIVVAAAREVAPTTQVLMINMTRDIVFPIAGAFELFDAFSCPKRIAFWEGGHTELPPESMAMARSFLRGVIAGVAEPAGAVDAW